MNEMEKQLQEKKRQLETVKAPASLAERLQHALDAIPAKRKPKPKWPFAAAAILLACLIGFNYNGLAYYGKKIMGFDDIMGGTLAELNDKGMGQAVEKETRLEDGTILTVDGIMTDANQLILYYTLSGVEEMEDIVFGKITGFRTDSNKGGGFSTFDEDHSEIKGQLFFDPVSPFAKKLTLEVTKWTDDDQTATGTMSFPYDPNQAMKTQIEKKLMEKVKVDKGIIEFKSITATPSSVVIKGTAKVENLDRVQLPFEHIQLVVNGNTLSQTGSQVNTSVKGAQFELEFDALPEEIESVAIAVNEFVGYTKVDETIPLQPSGEQAFRIAGKELWVKKVAETETGVEVTIATDPDVMLDGVTLEGKGGSSQLETTIRQDEKELAGGTIVKERTLVFPAGAEPEKLRIKGMHHMKPVGKVIEIPVK